MLHRIREAFSDETSSFGGPVEVDETYVGGKRKNMSTAKRKELEDVGRGPVAMTAVVGMKDRATKQVTAQVIEQTDGVRPQALAAAPIAVRGDVRRAAEHPGAVHAGADATMSWLGWVGQRLMYRDLTAENGQSPQERASSLRRRNPQRLSLEVAKAS